MKNFLSLPAPAKLNLFLHIIGVRSDGYHLIQSVFQLIDLCDYIDLEENDSGEIIRQGDISWPVEQDLCVKAAKLLKPLAGNKGVTIRVVKNIPQGAGLGGGSSDAATALIGLNQLWNLGLSRNELINLGVQLGADVPFFLFGQNAFIEGIGDVLTPVSLPELYFKILFPNVGLSTRQIYNHPSLTTTPDLCAAASLPALLEKFSTQPFGRNDLEPAAKSLSKQINAALNLLRPFGSPRMTGSGSAVFVAVDQPNKIGPCLVLPSGWHQWSVKGLKYHPLFSWLS